MVVIGVALIAQAVDGHGGVISPRLLLGLLFIAAGGGRMYLETKRGGSREHAGRTPLDAERDRPRSSTTRHSPPARA